MGPLDHPSLEPVTELSTELFRFWNSISSWGFRFEGSQMGCEFISLDQFRFKGKVHQVFIGQRDGLIRLISDPWAYLTKRCP